VGWTKGDWGKIKGREGGFAVTSVKQKKADGQRQSWLDNKKKTKDLNPQNFGEKSKGGKRGASTAKFV